MPRRFSVRELATARTEAKPLVAGRPRRRKKLGADEVNWGSLPLPPAASRPTTSPGCPPGKRGRSTSVGMRDMRINRIRRLSGLAAVGAALTPMAAGCASSAKPAQHSLPQAWDACYVMFLSASGPSSRPASPGRDEVVAEHIQYQLKLTREGNAVAAGGVGAGADPTLRGVTVLRAADLQAAKALAERDPAVMAGLFSAEVREWYLPAPGICSPD